MATLAGRIAIKDLANISRADTRWDSLLDLMRDMATRTVEEMTGRTFGSQAREEIHPSYEQSFGDPSPQYVYVNAPPIDTGQTVTLVWAPFDDHDTNGTPLTTPEDWKFELDPRGVEVGLRVQRFTTFPLAAPVPAGAIGTLGYSPTGFRINYTGGYTVTATGLTDPLDAGEDDVAQVPSALASLFAQKLANDFKFLRAQRRLEVRDPATFVAQAQVTGGFGVVATPGLVRPWTEQERAFLMMFARKDLSWVGPWFTPSAGRPVEGGG